MAPALRKLVTQQTTRLETIKRTISRRKKLKKGSLAIPVLRSRLQKLNDLWKEACETHNDILYIAESETDPYVTENHFEKMEVEWEAESDFLTSELYDLTEAGNSSQSAHQLPAAHSISDKLKLPKSTLPQFSGKYEDWGNFSDLFVSMIDKDQSIPKVVKLQYLKQCLTDEAADLVKDIKVEEANYTSTWESLKNRYCNVRLLIHTHFNALYSLPKLQKESVSDLKTLIDKTRLAVRSLKNIGREIVGDWLVYHTAERLDPESRRQWENHLSTRSSKLSNTEEGDLEANQYPSFEDLANFIDDRIITLNMTGSLPKASPMNSNNFRINQGQKSVKRTFHNVTESKSQKRKCPKCSAEHYIGRCPAFKQLSSLERRNEARRLKLCFNCLGGHQFKDCSSKGRCFECKEQHHTLLHRSSTAQISGTQENTKLTSPQGNSLLTETTSSVQAMTTSVTNTKRRILLATACAVLQGPKGERRVRAMLDQGSEVSFISKDVVNQLGLPCYPANVTILGLGNHKVGESQTIASMNLKSLQDPSFQLEFQAYVVQHLTTQLPVRRVVELDLDGLDHNSLADPYYYMPGTIQLIIGADYYGQILRPGLYQIESPRATAQNSALGWIISGPVESDMSRRADPNSSGSVTSMHCTPVENLQNQLQRFWELESIPDKLVTRPDDEYCEKHYINTFSRTPEGRYQVRLPLKHQPPDAAAETRHMALGSLLSMERRFKQDHKLSQAYRDFMESYESDGHMERVPSDESNHSRVWYLPHHAVVQLSNMEWKLRVVFNASRLTSERESLNHFLHTGPALQNDLGLVLLNWRRHRIVFTADIVKMFRQILVHPADCDLQRILWRQNTDAPLEEFRLKTVTYGTACAPYLAIRTLRQLTIDEGTAFPLGAQCLRENIYVDDIFEGGDNYIEAKQKRDELISLSAMGGLKLDKWASNQPQLLESLKTDSTPEQPPTKIIDKHATVKTLGILWNSKADDFVFNIAHGPPTSEEITKRTISSHIARLYDPMGWLSPVTVVAKIMLQDIWIVRIDWDTALPTELKERWTQYYQTLSTLPTIKIPRWLGTSSNSLSEIHGFSDASSRAYAAAVYLRVVNDDGSVHVNLLVAKSKVSPIKTVSIPNLELCGAVLLIKLLNYVRRLTPLKNASVTAWSDSQVTLTWLKQHPSKWKTFVANRVSYIQTELPSAIWRHVPSEDNPADLGTRGIQPEMLRDHQLWWHGPSWLSQSSDHWPSQSPELDSENSIIRSFLTLKPEVDDTILSRFSCLKRLLRVVAYCLRVFENYKGRKSGHSFKTIILSPTELDNARIRVLKLAQARAFAGEITALKERKVTPKGSVIQNLNPFLDAEGILRVGGRLRHSSLIYSKKHPPILPKESPLAPLYVNLAHKISCHGGPKLTCSILLNLVWIIGAASLVRKLIRKCVLCHRVNPRFPIQLMGDLPATRVEPARPFTNSGLDYAGPFQLRTTKGRGYKSYKGYMGVFVCFATKAIHLEAVSDLTTAAFLAAFRRFTGRRGLCRNLYSDNGSTFQGADRELRSMFNRGSTFHSEIAATLANDGTNWHFIPPNSPHFGGLWEAGVKSAKHHLVRLLVSRTCTFEEFSTLLVEVECCLNSRPLCAMSTDPEDLDALTPAHFLIGSTLAVLPDEEPPNVPENRLDRYQLMQKIRNNFWRKWSQEYLQSMQARGKWQRPSENLCVDQLVIIRDDRFPPAKWPIGRVIAVHPGLDKITRVATVKTTSGTYRRPIVRLSPIPPPN